MPITNSCGQTVEPVEVPYFILADDAFALRTYLMKPSSHIGMTRSKQIANYRISRGRRVVENAFGILASGRQCLLTTMQQGPDLVRDILKAGICLQNLGREDVQQNLIPGELRQQANMQEVYQRVGPIRDTMEAKQMRENFRLYFNIEAGSVP
ncbi:uncharacterized protein LOC124142835 [Haliotis rufescens]|uniref:uncharacterized protein LOC124142835 n=1 Tax=Haliotis rufescens TaxID=6454 RepID=UPI00201E883E|nr:uncharacterized protein LOC124142835 [Haliotis rufescens]